MIPPIPRGFFPFPILYYHRVAPGVDPQTGVTPESFRRQVTLLADLGYRGVTLREALARAADSRGASGPSPIVLTFDDGYLDNYEHAAPILDEQGFRATIYFVAERMGGRVDWTEDPLWGGHALMDAGKARELVEKGFEAGSHTLTHPDLAKLSEAEARREIAESRPRLEDHLSAPVTTFCYPYGSFLPIHAGMVREAGYDAARTVRRYRLGRSEDLMTLACRPVSGRMGLGRFGLTVAAYRVLFPLRRLGGNPLSPLGGPHS
ncbi:MAG: polysaccharide deacetylase family protein [Leptospirillia bacterium]